MGKETSKRLEEGLQLKLNSMLYFPLGGNVHNLELCGSSGGFRLLLPDSQAYLLSLQFYRALFNYIKNEGDFREMQHLVSTRLEGIEELIRYTT
jgi:hypothetical protein